MIGGHAHSPRTNVMSTSRLRSTSLSQRGESRSSCGESPCRHWKTNYEITCRWGQRTNLVRGEAGHHQQNTKAGVTAVDNREKNESLRE